MDYLYGELINKVTPVEYGGDYTETAKVKVDNDLRVISAEIPLLDKYNIKNGTYLDYKNNAVSVISSTEDGVYTLEVTRAGDDVSIQWGTKTRDQQRQQLESISGNLEDLNQELDKTDLVAAINSENARAKTVEGNLQDLITDDKSSLVAAINSESERAASVEGDLSSINVDIKEKDLAASINKEYLRAKAAESELDTRIGSNQSLTTGEKDTVVGAVNELAASIQQEAERAAQAESDLNTQLSQKIENETERVALAVEAEKVRATGVEDSLSARISTVESSAIAQAIAPDEIKTLFE